MQDVVQQFPCFRLPIVAAFDWLRPQGLNKRINVRRVNRLGFRVWGLGV